jgi:hypothetical protein
MRVLVRDDREEEDRRDEKNGLEGFHVGEIVVSDTTEVKVLP